MLPKIKKTHSKNKPLSATWTKASLSSFSLKTQLIQIYRRSPCVLFLFLIFVYPLHTRMGVVSWLSFCELQVQYFLTLWYRSHKPLAHSTKERKSTVLWRYIWKAIIEGLNEKKLRVQGRGGTCGEKTNAKGFLESHIWKAFKCSHYITREIIPPTTHLVPSSGNFTARNGLHVVESLSTEVPYINNYYP